MPGRLNATRINPRRGGSPATRAAGAGVATTGTTTACGHIRRWGTARPHQRRRQWQGRRSAQERARLQWPTKIPPGSLDGSWSDRVARLTSMPGPVQPRRTMARPSHRAASGESDQAAARDPDILVLDRHLPGRRRMVRRRALRSSGRWRCLRPTSIRLPEPLLPHSECRAPPDRQSCRNARPCHAR